MNEIDLGGGHRSMTAVERIRGAERLVAIFDSWPSFRDAEVIWMHLDRRPHDEGTPTLEALVRTFEITAEVDRDGKLVLRHYVQVHLRFRGIRDLKLTEFGHQNSLHGLSIIDIRDWQWEQIDFEMMFDSNSGVDAFFQCRTVEVVGVLPGIDSIEPIDA